MPPTSDSPANSDWLDRYHDYRFGLNGTPRDIAKAVECARTGHEAGDLNCTYMLCACYEIGDGVPRDYRQVLRLAREMVDKGFTPGYYFIAATCAEGWGVPLNRELSRQHAEYVLKHLSRSVAGVHEDVRYLALFNTLLLEETNVRWRLFKQYAEEFFQKSRLHVRYGMLALAIRNHLGLSTHLMLDARKILDEGCLVGDPMSRCVKGVFLMTGELYQQDEEAGRQLLLELADEEGIAEFQNVAYNIAGDEERVAHYDRRFWLSCQRGLSFLPREDELPCEIELHANPNAYYWPIYEEEQALLYAKAGMLDAYPMPPTLHLKNTGTEPLRDMDLRICCADTGVEKTIPICPPLQVGEERTVLPLNHNIDLGNKLYVVATSGEKYSELKLANEVADFIALEADVPPIIPCWGRGARGGYYLKLYCTRGHLTDVVIKRLNEAETAPTALSEDHPLLLDSSSFSDKRELQAGERIFIFSREYPIVHGIICAEPAEMGFFQRLWLRARAAIGRIMGNNKAS